MRSLSWTRRLTLWLLLLLLALASFPVSGSVSYGINHTHAALGIHHFDTKHKEQKESFTLSTENWYQRYPAYPEYCSTPEMMAQREIPPLETDYRVGDSRLVHVSSIIRHGARTPYSNDLDCWKEYWNNMDESVWNCNLTTMLAPPLTESESLFLFEKQYNALEEPLKNELNGTCQVGQLLLRGFVQEVENGRHLRNAYTFDGTTMEHDARMRLLDLSSTTPRPFELLKYRSDDDQRTLMSGQVLLNGLFQQEFIKHKEEFGRHAIVPLHTADRSRDILSPAERLCDKLGDLRLDAENSKQYKAFLKSKESRQVEKYIDDNLGEGLMQEGALDCIMTTICTDRTLPHAIDDYGRNTTEMMRRIYENDIAKWAFHVTYNDGAYAKLAMGPLWAEILGNIQPILDGNDRQPPPNRLALFSGHDTTILPLLVSLGPDVWDGKWPPYASMMIIEIHELIDGKTDRSIFKSDFAFRLLMNGQVLTSKVEGCPADADLCDVQVLLDRVEPFATTNRDCTSHRSKHVAIEEAEVLLSTTGGKVLVLFVTIASAFLGSCFTYCFLTRRLPCRKRSTYKMGIGDSSNGYRDEVGGGFHDEPGDDDEEEYDLQLSVTEEQERSGPIIHTLS